MIGDRLFNPNLARDDGVYPSADRGFGLTFAAVGVAVGIANLWWGERAGWIWLAGAGALLGLAVASPRILSSLNRLWGRFAVLLRRLVTPIVVLVVFVTSVVPVGVIMRALGKDPLRLKPHAAAATYWIDRKLPGPAPGTMKNQF